MAFKPLTGYTVKKGAGGIPIYTPTKPKAPPLKWQPPGVKYTGTIGTGGIPIYTPNRVAAGDTGGGTNPADDTPAVEKRAGSWFIPDYDTLLAGDWEPDAAAIRGKEWVDSKKADYGRAFKRAYVDWGGDPTKLSAEFRQYLDDATIEEARGNKYSRNAQNLREMTKNLTNQDAHNEAQGMATSGRSVSQAREGLESKEKADWGDYRTFLGGAEEGLQGIAQADLEAAGWLDEANSRAAARIATNNPHTWIPGTDEQQAEEDTLAGRTPVPAAKKPVFKWGGKDIFTKAQLLASLGYNQNITTWRNQHPGLWEKLA